PRRAWSPLAVLYTTIVHPHCGHYCGPQESHAFMKTWMGVSATARDTDRQLTTRFEVRESFKDALTRSTAPRVFRKAQSSTVLGARLDVNGSVVDIGRLNGSVILELSGWASHSLSTKVLAILAAEAVKLTEQAVGLVESTPYHTSALTSGAIISSVKISLERYVSRIFTITPSFSHRKSSPVTTSYLQATMANNGIPAYFCFLGYDGAQSYVVAAQERRRPVAFYHYEPDPSHFQHPAIFQRVFLPQADPEAVTHATGTFGDHGYGIKSSNSINVDFPSTQLMKYASNFVHDYQPLASFLSQFSVSSIHVNELMRLHVNPSTASP
ncbi:TPA: hypothetical protein N0F65_006725, partial [Lagenidium giganteum]